MPRAVRSETRRVLTVAGCELCEAAPLTPWHHHDDVCWVADCESCDLPMVVWKRHGTEPSDADRDHMFAVLGRVADEQLGADAWRLDAVRRQIPDHFHAHARRSFKPR
jgi:hypothetical protein